MKRIDKIYKKAPEIKINNEDKFVIFSDLHMGNSGSNDDFQKNAKMFNKVLSDYYLQRNYQLILNGDIEELYKFSYKKINDTWAETYDIFDKFNAEDRLFKLFGNHDYGLIIHNHQKKKYLLLESLILDYFGNKIFIYHGHQTSKKLEQYSNIALFFIKYFLRTISNKDVSLLSTKKYETEEIAYNYSSQKKIVSILGHTHRPLFESLSKADSLKILLENLLRRYVKAEESNRDEIIEKINYYKGEFEHIYEKNLMYHQMSGVYDDRLIVPCLFNSGTITGKSGFTGIEIKKGKIYLVYWFDSQKSQKYLHYESTKVKQLIDTDYHKAVIKKDSLDYIFSKIKFLSNGN